MKAFAYLVGILMLGVHVFAEEATRRFDLGEIFRAYGTDKDINGYTPIYHTLFHSLRNHPVRLLEIGIGTMIPGAHSSMVGYAQASYKPGGSLRAWQDYFENGTIHGADVQPDTQFDDEPRITTHLCNSMDTNQVHALMQDIGEPFDIIIDDGSHIDANQLQTLANFYPYLKDGGLYIIEDIYTGSRLTTDPKAIAEICNHNTFFFVGIHNNICVIYKNPLR